MLKNKIPKQEIKLASANSFQGIIECIEAFWEPAHYALHQADKNIKDYTITKNGVRKDRCFVRVQGEKYYFIMISEVQA